MHRAIGRLRPGSRFALFGNVLSGLVWYDETTTPPTQAEVDAEMSNVLAMEAANAYKGKRSAEYPPMTDYLDAVVKGDMAQKQAYIDACLAVKAKWPKP